MIFYFTGTGNSRYIAEILRNVLEDQLISINKCLKAEKKYNFTSAKPFVIVCPTYAWRIPRVVEQFIKDSVFFGNRKFYFILTCGGNTGQADKYVKRLIVRKNMKYMGLAEIKMPENFITMFQAPAQKEARQIVKQAMEPTLKLARKIKKEQYFDKMSYHFGSYLQSAIINPFFYKIYVKDDDFYTTDQCIGCQHCVKVCPLNNIAMKDKRPYWKHHCTQCMACIASCPKQAIEYGKRTQGKIRYYLDEDNYK